MHRLRTEILIRKQSTGCVSLYDPLLQVIHDLDVIESKNFLQPAVEWSPALVERFRSAVLLEGSEAEHIREQF